MANCLVVAAADQQRDAIVDGLIRDYDLTRHRAQMLADRFGIGRLDPQSAAWDPEHRGDRQVRPFPAKPLEDAYA